MPIEGCGTVVLEMNTTAGIVKVTLDDVWYIPTIQFNLFSLPRVMERGFSIKFIRNACFIMRNDEVYAQGFKHNLLYTLDIANPLPIVPDEPSRDFSNLSLATTPSADVWHARLGHISVKHMNKTRQYTKGIDIDDCKHQFCESCLAGKQSRLPFPQRSLTSSSAPFDLVHSDICGPMCHPSISNRARYFITFTDDYTRYGFVYFLKHKWEALQHLQAFTAFCRTQFNRQVRCLRSDNGGEYISHAFSTFLIENGIRQEKTVPHTPQQNGVSERMN
ncbi:hypothetical protein AeMF1_005125, partial [Aphanomyces euteiches]